MQRKYEQRVRRLAERNGYRVVKSRRQEGLYNLGEYRLVDDSCEGVVLGTRFDASLEDIEAFFVDEDGDSPTGLVVQEGQDKTEQNGQRRAV